MSNLGTFSDLLQVKLHACLSLPPNTEPIVGRQLTIDSIHFFKQALFCNTCVRAVIWGAYTSIVCHSSLKKIKIKKVTFIDKNSILTEEAFLLLRTDHTCSLCSLILKQESRAVSDMNMKDKSTPETPSNSLCYRFNTLI